MKISGGHHAGVKLGTKLEALHLMSPAPGEVQMPRSSRCLAVRLMACGAGGWAGGRARRVM